MSAPRYDLSTPYSSALWVMSRFGNAFPIDNPEAGPKCIGWHKPEAPCDGSRGKHPCWQWSTPITSRDGIAKGFMRMKRNIGLACGPAKLLVVDEDEPGAFAAYAESIGQVVPVTFTVQTARGRHFYFQQDGHYGNTEGALRHLKIDVRGKGGMVVAPGSLHASGVVYTPDDPDAVVAELPDWLGRALEGNGGQRKASTASEGRIWEHLQHPWDKHRGPIKAGAAGGRHKALVSFAGLLRSEGVPQDLARLLTEHRWQDCEQPPGDPYARETALEVVDDAYSRWDGPEQDEDAAEAPAPSWAKKRLTGYLDGTYQRPTPTLLPRKDGVCLMYPGMTHSFHGESESGKSLLMQIETARLLKLGQRVLYLDYESDESTIVERLLLFGCTPAQIDSDLFDYRRPEADPSKLAIEREEFRGILEQRFALVVIDGVTDALVQAGKSGMDAQEYTDWVRAVPRRIATRTGAAVAMVDHVAKDAESRGRFALGTQAKMNSLTGAGYVVEVAEPLGRGLRGVVIVRVAKDRHGYVRVECGPMRKPDRTQEASKVIVDSTGEHPVVTFEAPRTGQAVEFRPTALMEKVSRYVEVHPAATKNAVVDAVGGNRKYLIAAIDQLVEEGWITVEDGKNRARHHTVAKAYRQDEDPLSDAYAEPEPLGAAISVAGGSPPIGGENHGTTSQMVPRTTQNHSGTTEPAAACDTCGQAMLLPGRGRTTCAKCDRVTSTVQLRSAAS